MISWVLLPISVVQNPAWRMPCFSQIRSVSRDLADDWVGGRPDHYCGALGRRAACPRAGGCRGGCEDLRSSCPGLSKTPCVLLARRRRADGAEVTRLNFI